MDVAVIIPLFNGARWIRQTLESVFCQSLYPREVVVVDDGSEDESPDIVKSFPEARLLRNPNKGVHFARNFGLHNVTAPLIIFLDQDDLWHPDHLKILSSILEQYPDCPAAVANSLSFKSEENLVFSSPKIKPESFDPWQNFPINFVPAPSTVLIRRSALDALGGWTTNFIAGADVHMWFKLSASHALIINRDVTVGYRYVDNSYSILLRLQKIQNYFEAITAACDNALSYRLTIRSPDPDAELLKKRLKILKPIAGILKGTINSELLLLKVSALALEVSLQDESQAFIEAVCNNTLFWFLVPSLCTGSVEQRHKFLNNLLESWPKNAYKTRQIIFLRAKRIVSIWIFLKYVQSNPLQLRRWPILVDVVRSRIYRGV